MKLPRGVRLDHGYVQVRLFHRGQYVLCKNFGPPCDEAFDAASAAYLEAKKRIREGQWGIKREPRAIKFSEARGIFYRRHYLEYRNPNTHAPRTEGSIQRTRTALDLIGKYFDGYWLHEVGIKEIKAYKERAIEDLGWAAATFNKHRMFLSSLFTQFRMWGQEDALHAIRLPTDGAGGFYNPCDGVGTLTENKRQRVPSAEELAKAHEWCKVEAPELWYAIEMALMTALRKSDLLSLTGEVKGVQHKTGDTFSLPHTLERPIEYSKHQWNRLRDFMGWRLDGGSHTTWHDLRHWAPTLLAQKGYSIPQMQSYTAHKDPKALARYINLQSSSVPDMLENVKSELRKIRRSDEQTTDGGDATPSSSPHSLTDKTTPS